MASASLATQHGSTCVHDPEIDTHSATIRCHEPAKASVKCAAGIFVRSGFFYVPALLAGSIFGCRNRVIANYIVHERQYAIVQRGS